MSCWETKKWTRKEEKEFWVKTERSSCIVRQFWTNDRVEARNLVTTMSKILKSDKKEKKEHRDKERLEV